MMKPTNLTGGETAGIKELLLQAADDQLDASMFPLIAQWNEPFPTALQVLEVLDSVVFCALASGFTVQVLQMLYAKALEDEGTTNEEVELLATWRVVGKLNPSE